MTFGFGDTFVPQEQACFTADGSGDYVMAVGVCPAGTAPAPGTTDAAGFTEQACNNAGRTWSNGVCLLNNPTTAQQIPSTTPATSTDFLTQLLNMITGKNPAATAVTTAAACTASGGSWNGVTCTPATNWMPWIIGGVAILLITKMGKR